MPGLKYLPGVSLVPTNHFSPTFSHLCFTSSNRANHCVLVSILCPVLCSFTSFSVFAKVSKMSLCPSPLFFQLMSFPIHTSESGCEATFTHTAPASSLKHLPSLKLRSFRRSSRTVDQKGSISPYRNILYIKLLLGMNSMQQTHKTLKNGSLPLQCGLRTGVSNGGVPCLSTVLRGAYTLGGFRRQRQHWGRPIRSHTASEFIVCNAVLWTHVLGR